MMTSAFAAAALLDKRVAAGEMWQKSQVLLQELRSPVIFMKNIYFLYMKRDDKTSRRNHCVDLQNGADDSRALEFGPLPRAERGLHGGVVAANCVGLLIFN